jgi:TatD DNase family protein
MSALIDTHAHLDAEQFRDDLPAVLERARAADVERMVAVATTHASTLACLALARRYPFLHPTAGIHPNHVAEAAPEAWDAVAELALRPEVVGIGETGLDRHWHDTPFPQQQDFFARHLDLSRRTGKPIIIHCREAAEDLLPMLRDEFDKHGPLVGIMHSFVGDTPMAETCLAMGLYLSFAGMLTYKNAVALRETAATVPFNRLLVETDCPYLAPVPKRGQRNEPANVTHTAAVLAGLVGLSPDELAVQTTASARALFRIP